jgi:hypothetical protein
LPFIDNPDPKFFTDVKPRILEEAPVFATFPLPRAEGRQRTFS